MAQGGGRRSAWGGTLGTLGEAMVRAGVSPPVTGGESFDALDEATERAWFPVDDAKPLEGVARVDAEAARVLGRGAWQNQLANMLDATGSGAGREAKTATAVIFNALRLRALPPWELALQRWLADVAPGARTFARAPGARTFARPSRRQGARCDVVLAGCRRDAWTLNLLLDTSGSMWSELGKVLGIIAGFCTAVDVIQVRILQCSNGLERDEIIAVEDLAAYRVQGGGGSDLRPGFHALAADPGVDAAVVVTDGVIITYPQQPMPFAVLWTLIGRGDGFTPPYGQLLRVQL
jgi:predicted metal-dependent peptidase